MRTAPPEGDCSWQHDLGPAPVLPGLPWAVRLAGRESPCPALEIYQAGVLLDVVSSTRLSAPLLRGAQSAGDRASSCVLAWGRLPVTGASPEVAFGRGRRRPYWQPGTVLRVTSWCWLAAAEGRFDRVAVRRGDRCVRARVRRQPR